MCYVMRHLTTGVGQNVSLQNANKTKTTRQNKMPRLFQCFS